MLFDATCDNDRTNRPPIPSTGSKASGDVSVCCPRNAVFEPLVASAIDRHHMLEVIELCLGFIAHIGQRRSLAIEDAGQVVGPMLQPHWPEYFRWLTAHSMDHPL